VGQASRLSVKNDRRDACPIHSARKTAPNLGKEVLTLPYNNSCPLVYYFMTCR